MEQVSSLFETVKPRVARVVGLLIPILLLACLSGWASPAGSISGTIVDPSGAVIPGVTLVIRNVETGMQQTTTTNSDGFFLCLLYLPGTMRSRSITPDFAP